MLTNEMITKAQEAYETSTIKDNRFRKFVQNFDWDDFKNYEEDGLVFTKGDYQLCCDGLDPFDMGWKPEVLNTEDWNFYYSF